MSRWCACLTADDPAGQVAAMGGRPVPTRAGRRHAFGLLDGPGAAAGPYRVGDVYAIGEVTLHNAPELRARLGAGAAGVAGSVGVAGAAGAGPVPRDCSDGELLLRAYVRFGTAGLAAADGMFALAIVEGDELVLVRDHMGARTLFHARAGTGDRAAWGASTSLRALQRWPALDTGLHLPAVRSFLTFAYLPGRETLLRGIHEVLPGRCVRLKPDGSTVEETYWEPAEVADERPAAEHARELRELLESATARRLPVAEPVGVLLSGGVDSSLVTALAAKLHDQPSGRTRSASAPTPRTNSPTPDWSPPTATPSTGFSPCPARRSRRGSRRPSRCWTVRSAIRSPCPT